MKLAIFSQRVHFQFPLAKYVIKIQDNHTVDGALNSDS